MAKQLESINHLMVKLKSNSLELESIQCTGMASDGLGYVKSVSDWANIKQLSQEEQDAALLLVKYAKNRIETTESDLVKKPDPIIK